MKKVLLMALVLCLGFIKVNAQSQSISVPMGYSTGQCDITHTNYIQGVGSTITADISAANADGYQLVYTYVDLYVTDTGGDPDYHDFESLGSPTSTTPLSSGTVSASWFNSNVPGHSYGVQYEYYALYYNPTDQTYHEEYGECSAGI